MPTDPSIILGMQYPQILSPQDQQAKANALQGQQQESQLRSAAIQTSAQEQQDRQLQIAARTKNLAGQDALAASIKKNTSQDPTSGAYTVDSDGIVNEVSAAGFPNEANAWAKMQSDNAENLQKLQEAHRAYASQQLETVGGLASTAQSRDDFVAGVGLAAAHGLLDEQTARGVVSQVDEAGGDAWKAVAQHYQQLAPSYQKSQTPEGKAALAKTLADAAKATAEANLANAKAAPPDPAKFQAQIDAIVPANDLTNAGLRRMTIARVQNARTTDDAEKAIDEASKQVGAINVAKNTVPAKIAVQMGGLTTQQAGGEPNPTAKAIAEYRMAPLSSFAMARPAGQELMRQVTELNPAYDATNFTNRQKTRTSYTTGTEGQQLNAMNTAIMHMDLLSDAADALKNGEFKPGNAVYNKFSDMFGQTPPSSYAGIKEFLDGEVGSVVKKGVATEGEMGRLATKAGAEASPEQMSQYIKNSMNILAGKAAVLDDKYHSVMGASDPFSAISPRSQDVLVKHGFNPANFGGASSNGPSTGGSATSKFSVGQTVQIGDKKIKITTIHPDGTFDGDVVK